MLERGASEKLGIAILDLLVIGRAGHTSFRSLGLLLPFTGVRSEGVFSYHRA